MRYHILFLLAITCCNASSAQTELLPLHEDAPKWTYLNTSWGIPMVYTVMQFRYGDELVQIGEEFYQPIEWLSINALGDTMVQEHIYFREDSDTGVLWNVHGNRQLEICT